LKVIERACKPEAHDKDGKPKKKKSGLVGKISTITAAIDKKADKIKEAAGYKKTAANAWIDDHCSGLWLKAPQTNKYFPAELKKDVEDLLNKLDMGPLEWLNALKDAAGEVFELAYEVLPKEVVEKMAAKLAVKTGIKAGVGAAGVETIIIPVLMALWTAYDIYDSVSTLAAAMGEVGEAAMKAFDKIWNIGDEVKNILKGLVNKPGEAYANLMTLLALLDSCIRARKCLLVKYSESTGLSPLKGEGCCPGQTAHHLIPDKNIPPGVCAGYTKRGAPTICLEGSSNNAGWGSHGNAHAALKKLMEEYRLGRVAEGKSPNSISYDKMADHAIDAVRLSGAALQCSKACLRAQLDAYYKCGKGTDGLKSGDGQDETDEQEDDCLKPGDGTCKMPRMPEPLPKEDTETQ
jgi:hypothetical protein